MKNRRAFYIALIVAILGAVFVKLTLDAERRKLAQEYELINVVVAAKDILRYDIITPDVLAIKKVPKPYVQPLALIAGEEARIVNFNMADASIKQGEQVTRTKLALIGEGGISPIIPSKMRACTISINDVSGVAGLIRNRDTVDVIGLFQTAGKNSSKAEDIEASTILQNVQVLAVGRNYVFDRQSQGLSSEKRKNNLFSSLKGNLNFSNITLLLTPRQCMDVALAQQIGDLSLSLRSYHDRLNSDIDTDLKNKRSTSQSVTGIKKPLRMSNQPKWLEMRGGSSAYVP